jgi:hypothetical protein
MIVENFKTAADNLGWVFNYGRRDFQNLVEGEWSDKDADGDDQTFEVYLFLDPTVDESKYSPNTGGLIEEVWSGRAMLLRKSDLDEIYFSAVVNGKDKYQQYLKPLHGLIQNELRDELSTCGDWSVQFRLQEIVNVFSENMDGWIINYKVSK